MKIKFQCGKCFSNGYDTIDFVQVQEKALYHYECSKGHKNVYFQMNEKFELLMESAVYAINDGYYREAISSMNSSLERFYEYFIKVLFKENDMITLFDNSWNQVSKMSERQLGAFTFLYILKYKSIPDNLTDSERNFRNKVIHNGDFCSYEETIKHGQRILDIIFKVLNKLEDSSDFVISSLTWENHEKMMLTFEKMDVSPFTVRTDNIINLHSGKNRDNAFDLIKYLELVKTKKQFS